MWTCSKTRGTWSGTQKLGRESAKIFSVFVRMRGVEGLIKVSRVVRAVTWLFTPL